MRAFRNSRKYRKTKRNLFSIKIREILRINIGGRKVERYFCESFEIQGNLKKKNETKSISSKFGFDSLDELCINIRRRKVEARGGHGGERGTEACVTRAEGKRLVEVGTRGSGKEHSNPKTESPETRFSRVISAIRTVTSRYFLK